MPAAPSDTTISTATPREPATWYCFLLAGFYIYSTNVQGNVVPFLQAEFALSYRAVSLHSSALAAGIILVGLFGERVAAALGRRKTLWLGVGGLAGGGILLCLAPAAWASITACFLIGALGALLPAVIPALLADIHGARRVEAYAAQAIVAYSFGLAAPLLAGAAIWLGLGWRAAVLLGVGVGLAITVAFRRTAIVEPAAVPHDDARRESEGLPPALPPAFWAYWVLMATTCALEFSILFWAPAFLERVVGFGAATAATMAAGFPLGVLSGRIALRALVRRMSPRHLLVGALVLLIVGFVLYWGVGSAAVGRAAAVAGIVVIGLGVAPLYPLITNFAVGAAPHAAGLASMRLALSFGLAFLLAPIALGALADEAGLGPAHLALPVLIGLSFLAFFIGEALEQKAAAARA
jgi:fucose permease